MDLDIIQPQSHESSSNPRQEVTHEPEIIPDPGSLDDLREHEPELPVPPPEPFYDPDAGNDPMLETDVPNAAPVIEDIKISLAFIDALKNASLKSEIEPLDEELLAQILNPPEEQLTINDPDARLSLDIFLATGNASEETYTATHTGIL